MPERYETRLRLPGGREVSYLLLRFAVVIGLFLLAWGLLWIERDGLSDTGGDSHMSALDVLYFAVVTVTTLGYGDIVPVSAEARAMVAFGITPLRIATWLVLITTAYDLVVRSTIDRLLISRMKHKLDNHTIICGFGVKGRAAAKELLDRGVQPSEIVVIESNQEALDEATRIGIAAIRGNAASERNLLDAGLERAAAVLVLPNSDEVAVLTCLTAREISKTVKILAAAREDENVKLIQRAGADSVVAPSVSGGRLLAASTTSPWAATLLEEMLDYGRGADLFDYEVDPADIGSVPAQVPDLAGQLVLAVHRANGETLSHRQSRSYKLESGDTVVVYSPNAKP